MANDEPRVIAYRNALLYVADKKVLLEVGTGTGILAIIAARAGARMVHAVEASGMAAVAANNCAQIPEAARIKVYHGRIEKVDLYPDDTQVDIIFSEFMGYFLLHENMLRSVLIAKDRFLKKDDKEAIIIPH